MKKDKQAKKVPENDPSKAMNSKREVENSRDEKTDQDFPGYPHYPAKEDMMDERTNNHRVDVDVENLAAGQNASGINERYVNEQNKTAGSDAKRDDNSALEARND